MRNPNLSIEEQRNLERRLRLKPYSKHGLYGMVRREPFAALFLLVLTIWGALALVELALWQSESYPQALIKAAPAGNLEGLRQACGAPLEVKPIDSSIALTRCGLFWPVVSVWRVPRSIVDPTMWK